MKKILALILALAMVFTLCACGGKPSGSNTSAQLVVGAGPEPSGFDSLAEGTPQVILTGMCIYNKLFKVVDGELVGDLVDSWGYSGPDNLTLTLHLKEGVTFSNGNPFTAEDALFTISRIAGHMVYASRMASLDIDNCSCPDDYTVELKLKYYDVLLLACLTGEAGFVYDKETYDEIGEAEYSANPMGTGPYKLETWNHGTSVVLVKSENYTGDNPAKFDRIEIKFYSEGNTRELELEAGTLDIALLENGDNIDRVASGEVKGVSAYKWVTDKMGYLCMATTIADPTFQDENVRLAIANAIDIPAIVTAVMGSGGTPATSILPENNWAYSKNEYTMNLDKAKEYLAAAGLENGFSFEILVASDQNLDVKLAEAIQAYLQQVGIDMNIRSADQFTVMGEQMGGTQLCGILTSTIRGDVLELFDAFTPGSGNGLAQIGDAEFGEILSRARANSDQAVRAEALGDLQVFVHEHANFIPLYQLNAAWGYQDNITGVDTAALGAEAVIDLTQVSLK